MALIHDNDRAAFFSRPFVYQVTFILLVLALLFASERGVGQYKVNFKAIDSLERDLAGIPPGDPAALKVLKDLSSEYIHADAFKSIEYGRKAQDIIKRKKLPEDPDLLITLGKAYDRVPDFKTSNDLYKKALNLAQEQKNLETMVTAYEMLGWHYYRRLEFGSSQLNFEMALETADMIRNKEAMAGAYYGLGLIYFNMEDWKNQYTALTKYLELADRRKDARRMTDAWRLLGLYYQNENDNVTAISCYDSTYSLAASIGDSAMMGVAINHMAWAYYMKGDLERSLKVYEKNFEFTLPQGRAQTLANIYGNIGNIYRDWERYPEAIQNYKKSIEISEEAGDIFNLSWLYEDISLMNARMGKYKDAYEAFKLHSIYSDSLTSMSYRNRMMATQNQYEAEKKTRELELLNLQLDKNRYLIYGLTAGIALLILVGVLLIIQYRTKSRQRLEAMNHRISDLTQANLRQQMNPHFIFNTLNSIQYYVFQNDKISSNNYMTKFASLMRKTLENSRHTAISIKEELDALELYLDLESLRFKEKFDWSIEVDDEIDTLSYKIPTMLIQPFVENSITHGLMNKEGKGKISVKLNLKDDVIHCSIEDNGIGRDRAREIRKEKSTNHKSLGTTITESRLKLVNELYGKSMRVRYTDLYDSSGNPSGTKVEINIPIIT